jgi:hypothetical protein
VDLEKISMILFLLIFGRFFLNGNIIIMLMSIELMLLAVNLNFMVFYVYLDDMRGQLFAYCFNGGNYGIRYWVGHFGYHFSNSRVTSSLQ